MNKLKTHTYDAIPVLLSVLTALIIGAIIIFLNGQHPVDAYKALLDSALGSKYAIATTLSKTVPLILTAIATSVAFKSGIFNIGGEGQLYLGAFASAYIGFTFTNMSPIIAIPLAMIMSMIAGALFALIPAILKIRYDIDEVITTIMFNSIGIMFTSYLVSYPFKATDSSVHGSNAIAEQFRFDSIVPLTKLNTSFYYTILIGLLFFYIVRKTSIGYDLKVVGENRLFARYGGINDKKVMLYSMLLSGAICGLAGAFEVYGTHGRFLSNISNELAYDGMLVALIVKHNPIGILFMSVFFAILKTGSLGMEMQTGVPSELILIIQAIIILFIAGETGFKKLFQKKFKIEKEA